MFEMVLARGPGGPTHRSAGAVASFCLHAAGLAAALVISARAGAPAPKVEKPLPFFQQVAAPRPLEIEFREPGPAAPARPSRSNPAHAQAPQQRAAKAPPADASRVTTSPTAAPLSLDAGDGPSGSGPPDAPPGPASTGGDGTGTGVGTGAGASSVVMPFGPGMTRPQRIAGADPAYTREAMQARVQGKVLAKCVVGVDGTVRNCSIIKGLPYMDQAVLQALAGQRYTPALFQGRPTSVSYVFTFNFTLP